MRRLVPLFVLLVVVAVVVQSVAGIPVCRGVCSRTASRSASASKIVRWYDPPVGLLQAIIRYGEVSAAYWNFSYMVYGGYVRVSGQSRVSVAVSEGEVDYTLYWRGSGTSSSGSQVEGRLSGFCDPSKTSCTYCHSKYLTFDGHSGKLLVKAEAWANPWEWDMGYSCKSATCRFTLSISESSYVGEGDCGNGGGGGGGGSGASGYVSFYVVGGDGNRFYPFLLDSVRWGVNGSGYSVNPGVHVLGANSSRFYALLRRPVVVDRLGGGLTLYTSGSWFGDSLGYSVVRSVKFGWEWAARFKLAVYGRGSGDIYLRFPEGTEVALSHWESGLGSSTLSFSRVNGTTWRIHVRVRGYYSWSPGWVEAWIDYRKAYFYEVSRVEVYHVWGWLVGSTTSSSLRLRLGAYGYRVYIYVNASSHVPGARGFYVVPGGLVYVSNVTGVAEPVVRPLTGLAGDIDFAVYGGGGFESMRFRPSGGAVSGYRESMAGGLMGVEAMVFGHPGEMAALLATNKSTLYFHDGATELVYDVSGVRFAVTPVELRVLSATKLGDTYNITFRLVPLYLDRELGNSATAYPGGAGGLV